MKKNRKNLKSRKAASSKAKKKGPKKRSGSDGSGSKIVAKRLEIVYDALENDPFEHLAPPEIRRELSDDLHELLRKKPKEALERLIELKELYPDHPRICNLLMNACDWTGNTEKVAELAEENYRRAPNYLFARVNYANICMTRGEYDKVPELLGETFDIMALYPGRKRFHITEVVSFFRTAGLYFAGIGEIEKAKKFLEILKGIDPGGDAAKYLRRKIFFARLFGAKHA